MKYLIFATTVLIVSSLSLAQEHKEDGDHHHDSIVHLGPIDVLGEINQSNILNSVPTVSTLHGEELLKRSKNSLGETLNNEVGVNSSQFGPAASRPVIRGLEGDRIRILQNGIGVLDASGTSQDHAVPMNPLASESVEIVRGPINLLYGSSAIGGVVNIVNSRIHKDYYSGFFGAFDMKHESVNQGKNVAAKMDYGARNFMFHFDGNYLQAENTDTPLGEIQNSELEQHSLAVGSTYFTASKNYLGVSYSTFQNIYGAVSEADVDINLKQDRLDLAGYYQLGGFFKAVQVKSAQTFYKHTEFEDGQVGTVFENTGNETRLEFIQNNRGSFSGIIGLQTQVLEFSALGDEAFLPSTDQSSGAFFVFEEITLEDLKINTGLRGEWTQLKTNGDGFFPTTQENDFFAGSVALGAIYSLTSHFSSSFNVSYNERAPSYQELYSGGAHLAVGIYEQGDTQLNKEESLALEWSLRHKSKKTISVFTVFNQDFNNYIALNPSGTFADTNESGINGDTLNGEDDFEIYNYVSQQARIQGVELDFRYNWSSSFSTRLMGDYLYGQNRQTQRPLPRISPLRVGVELAYSKKAWQSSFEWRNVFKQTRTAPNETSTPSYNLLNLALNYKVNFGQESVLRVYGQINNIGDVKARNHVSVIIDQVLLPGRNFVAGVRLLF